MQSYENVYVYVRKESNSHRISLLQFYCPRTAHLGLFAHLTKTVMLPRL